MARFYRTGCLLLACHVLQKVSAALNGHCPPLGPVLPAPTAPSAHPAVQSSLSAFKSMLISRIESSPVLNASALSLGIRSIHEDGSPPLFEYSYTPAEEFRDPRGVQMVDSDTVFRLASLSKLFPVLAVLMQKGVDLDDPVTRYVPELRALNQQARDQTAIWKTDWDSVTIGALMSHLGGTPADMETDLAEHADLADYGFPAREESKLMHCSGLLGTPECDRKVFFERFGERAPVELPFSSNPVYSNIGFALLGFVVEAVTNKPFEQFLREEIFGPAGMTRSFATKSDDSLGYIPRDDLWWNATLGFEAPAGAYYSSITDLLTLGTSILTSKFLSAPQTRQWLKPVTHTSSTGTSLGRPWEIFRAQNVTSDGRLIELYTKGGDVKTYHSVLALIPDYDLVAAILIAGQTTSGFDVLLTLSQLVETILPAIETAGKAENEMIYAGTYTDEATNSTITLSLDDDDGDDGSPGLRLSPWVVRGVDVLTTSQGLDLPPLPFPPPPPPTSSPARFRLYPTTVTTNNQTSWRAVAALGTAEEVAAFEAPFVWPMAVCVTWGTLDRVTYMLQSQDHFVFTLDEKTGKAESVELVGYGVSLRRVLE